MKKVLLGLVIALMMTGSGYAETKVFDYHMPENVISKNCTYLKYNAHSHIQEFRQRLSFPESAKNYENSLESAKVFAELLRYLCVK